MLVGHNQMITDTLNFKHSQQLPSYNKWYHCQTQRKKKRKPKWQDEKASKEKSVPYKKDYENRVFTP